MEIVDTKAGKILFLLGNEAIAGGALEAGVDVITTYPGAPASEIGDAFSAIAKHHKKQGKKNTFFFEYSTNEKVAIEIASAASFCGLRALTCMKHVGMNVASNVIPFSSNILLETILDTLPKRYKEINKKLFNNIDQSKLKRREFR